MSTVVCTLFEGCYDVGATALLNSLQRAGFDGDAVCGYRGSRPAAMGGGEAWKPMRVSWLSVERTEHLTYVKPWLMLEILERFPQCDKVAYIDPDVVVKCDWDVIDAWMDGGVAAVEDVNGNITSQHPMRIRWRRFLADQGLAVACPRDVYVNAGFVGLERQHVALLSTWWDVVQRSEIVVGALTSLKNRGPNDLFHSADQDALNMALEVTPSPLHWVGKEGMDFAPGGSLLSHAIGRPKPWEGRALRRALNGYPPPAAAREFLRFAAAPVTALRPWRARRIGADLKLAQLVARTWRRAS